MRGVRGKGLNRKEMAGIDSRKSGGGVFNKKKAKSLVQGGKKVRATLTGKGAWERQCKRVGKGRGVKPERKVGKKKEEKI